MYGAILYNGKRQYFAILRHLLMCQHITVYTYTIPLLLTLLFFARNPYFNGRFLTVTPYQYPTKRR